MTREEHEQRIRQIQLQLTIADYGLGMPSDYQRILYLRQLLEQAKQDAIGDELKRLLSMAARTRSTSPPTAPTVRCRSEKRAGVISAGPNYVMVP